MNKKVNKDLFINNINYLMKNNYGLEFTIVTNCDSFNEYFIVLYKDYIEINNNDKRYVVKDVYELLDYIDYNTIAKIDSSLDFNFPFEKQSIIVDGKLWFNAITPTEEINRYIKRFTLYKGISAVIMLSVLLYMIISVFNIENCNFSNEILLMYSIIVLFIFGILLFDKKRNKLIEKYYEKIKEEDIVKARELLDKIKIVKNCEYDIIDNYNDYQIIKFLLKELSKGRRIHIKTYEIVKGIEDEIKQDKYKNIEFNNFIIEVCEVAKNNTIDF